MSVEQKIIDELSTIYPDSITLKRLIKVTALQKETIESSIQKLVDNRYPISKESDRISLSFPLMSIKAIDKELLTQFIGIKKRLIPSLESTNDYAKKNLSTLENGEIILAHEQTAGKGRLGREWSSPVGKSISMSIVLKPAMRVENISLLTQLTAAALVESMEEWIQAKIKWPNDILIDKKKVAGILIETEFSGATLKGIVIGIGLNTNLELDDIPIELQSKATSIKLYIKEFIDPNNLLSRFFTTFEKYYLEFLNTERTDPFLSICRERSVLLGQYYWVINDKIKRKALIEDINSSGALVVKYLDTDQTEIITSTDMSIRGDSGYV